MIRVKEFLLYLLKHFRSHIRYQLFFTYIAVIMSVMLIIGGVIYYFVPRVIEENFYQYMDKLSSQIIINIGNELSQMEQTSLMLNFEEDLKMVLDVDTDTGNVNRSSFLSSYKYIDNYFFNFIYSFQQIHGAYIYSLNGENIYTRNSNQAFHTTKHIKDEQWFKDALNKKGNKTILGRHKNKYVNDNTEVISLYRAVIDYSSNKVIGVIVIEEEVKKIGKIFFNLDMKGRSAVIVLDENNSLIYSSDMKLYEKISGVEDFNKKSYGVKNGSFVMGQGKDKIFVNQNLMENTGWKVITCQPYHEMMKEVNIIKGILQVTFLICLLATFAVSVLISGRIASKLVKMRKLVELVKKGNLDLKINVSGSDEVAGLAEGFNSMVARLKYLIEKEYNENLLRKEAELNLLQAQINPHFLYNTLGSIKSLAKDEGAEKATEMIQSLSNVFRYNLGRGKSMVTVGEELENIKNYLMLQQYRFEDKIKVAYDVDSRILEESILTMTLQPIVENCIIHGFEPKQGTGLLQIKGRHLDDHIKIYVIDDGVGMSVEKEQEINAVLENSRQFIDSQDLRRIGIYNVNSRLKYRFGGQYGLEIHRNANEGVTVEIMLPVKRDCNQ
jgi:two-component system, sensor histidine kinase YesM